MIAFLHGAGCDISLSVIPDENQIDLENEFKLEHN